MRREYGTKSIPANAGASRDFLKIPRELPLTRAALFRGQSAQIRAAAADFREFPTPRRLYIALSKRMCPGIDFGDRLDCARFSEDPRRETVDPIRLILDLFARNTPRHRRLSQMFGAPRRNLPPCAEKVSGYRNRRSAGGHPRKNPPRWNSPSPYRPVVSAGGTPRPPNGLWSRPRANSPLSERSVGPRWNRPRGNSPGEAAVCFFGGVPGVSAAVALATPGRTTLGGGPGRRGDRGRLFRWRR